MPRIQLWNNGAKSANYHFQDNSIRRYMNASGTGVYIHLYLGTYGQDGDDDKPIDEIQDVVFQENRDRKYSKDVFEMRGCYQVQDDGNFDLRQFGLFLPADSFGIEFHYNEMLELIGRKIIPGDVLELPHLRDDALLDEGKAINKFYVVTDADKAADGYGTTWLGHVWRVRVSPMSNSQEYADILETANTDPFGLETGGTLGDIIGSLANDLALNEAIVDEAKIYVSKRKLETRQFFMVPGDAMDANPWIYAGDGVPPNGATLLGSGDNFPSSPSEGDYYLRTDYSPHTLFRRIGSSWRIQELDYRRGGWNAMSKIFEEFLANTETTTFEDGTTETTRTALSKAIKPNTDF